MNLPAPGLPTFVGECNPYTSSPPEWDLADFPMGSAGHRLQSLILALDHDRYMGCGRVNLCRGAWMPAAARGTAKKLLELHRVVGEPERVMVLLGRKVATAFARVEGPMTHVRPEEPGLPHLLLFWHPSGRCTAWNDQATRERARAMLHELCPGLYLTPGVGPAPAPELTESA